MSHAMIRVVVREAGRLVAEIDHRQGVLRIGRSRDCNIVLTDSRVSSHHGRIEPTPSGLFEYVDSSTNGTFLEGKPIQRLFLDQPLELRLLPYTVEISPILESEIQNDSNIPTRRVTLGREIPLPPSEPPPAPVYHANPPPAAVPAPKVSPIPLDGLPAQPDIRTNIPQAPPAVGQVRPDPAGTDRPRDSAPRAALSAARATPRSAPVFEPVTRASTRIVRGLRAGTKLEFNHFPIRIGRDETSHVRLPEPTVSRLHAVIDLEGGHLFLTNESEANPVLVDGTALPWKARLALPQCCRIQVATVELEIIGVGGTELRADRLRSAATSLRHAAEATDATTIRVETLSASPDVRCLRLSGHLGVGTGIELQRRFESVLAGGCRSVVIDASHIDSISRSGLATLLFLTREIERSFGQILFTPPPRVVEELLRENNVEAFLAKYLCGSESEAVVLLTGRHAAG